ncbi:hypothetical protein MMYC01_204228 [Madurella mycetomatis]|uniref:Uncharacterized protein n=1 Tax=Madurella mycetomatis TaxID=100816 RepID=A0A175WB67_9PEZI|nr:hypothetical protein MMYC01_204228 [Madurella mycetomatis]
MRRARWPNQGRDIFHVGKLKDVQCYGLRSDAVSICVSRTRKASGKNGQAENLATLWKEAVCTFGQIPDAHGPKFPFGAALKVTVLMKIRAIEPVLLELVAWSSWSHWRPEIPDSACVSKELREKVKEIEEVCYKQRMEELHTPDLVALVRELSLPRHQNSKLNAL